MNTSPSSISVERLRELLAKATPGPWRWSENGNIVPEPYTDVEIAAVYTERDDDLAPANAELIIAMREALPALLQQLAEREAEILRLDRLHREACRIASNAEAKAEAAERAREEATGLLREAEPEIDALSNIHYSEFSNAEREKETEALHNRIAAFLAASGGKDNG